MTLGSVTISIDKEDERYWLPDSKGVFSVRSFYEVLQGSQEIGVD